MFGEKSIYGQKEVTLDNKGRIILPANTKREKGDNLILVYDEDISAYEILSFDIYDKIIEKLKINILNATNKVDEIYYKKRIYEISKSVIKTLNVDIQGRVILGKIYDNTNKVLCIGAYDRLILKPVGDIEKKM